MYLLKLHDVRDKTNNLIAVVRSLVEKELEDLLKNEEVDVYFDGVWKKYYRKNGLLEWYDVPAGDVKGKYIINIGSLDDWVVNSRKEWEDVVLSIPLLSDVLFI